MKIVRDFCEIDEVYMPDSQWINRWGKLAGESGS
jgi:hypothetical protein